MKKIISFLLSLCTCFLCITSVSAEKENTDFYSFFSIAVTNRDFYALNCNGQDISNSILNLYQKEGSASVYSYLSKNSGLIGYHETIHSGSFSAIEEDITVSDYRYVITNHKDYGKSEWRTRFTGTYYCNSKTGLITRNSLPVFSLVPISSETEFSNDYSVSNMNVSIKDESYIIFYTDYSLYLTDTENHIFGSYNQKFLC